jgi:hypothetical protein
MVAEDWEEVATAIDGWLEGALETTGPAVQHART